jgi:TIR domain-containing protein
VDSLQLGIDFRKHIQQAVAKCTVLVAVIGKDWAGSRQSANNRLKDPRDYVRIEIEAALERDIPVIPVLVQGALMPQENALPPALAGLAYRHGMPVRPDPDFHGDADRLIKGIRMHLRKPSAKRRTFSS